MINDFFNKMGAKKHEVKTSNSNKSKNEEVKLSVRNNGKGRKTIAVMFDKNIILNKLKWKKEPDEKIRLDVYYKRNEGIGFIKNTNGQYSLQERKLKNKEPGKFEVQINFKNDDIFNYGVDFSKLNNNVSFHEENNENLIWIYFTKK